MKSFPVLPAVLWRQAFLGGQARRQAQSWLFAPADGSFLFNNEHGMRVQGASHVIKFLSVHYECWLNQLKCRRQVLRVGNNNHAMELPVVTMTMPRLVLVIGLFSAGGLAWSPGVHASDLTTCNYGKKPEARILACTRALKLQQLSAYARSLVYNSRANAYYSTDRLDSAIADYSKAIKLNPRLDRAYYRRGNAYGRQGHYVRAIADYTETIKLNPKYVGAYNNRGNAYRKLGQTAQAIADYSKLADQRPDNGAVFYNRGVAYRKMGRPESALRDFTKVIELNPRFVGAYINRGNIYRRAGQDQKAIADYGQVIRLHPEYTAAYYNRAQSLRRVGRRAAAIKDYRKLLEIDPKHTRARARLRGLGVKP